MDNPLENMYILFIIGICHIQLHPFCWYIGYRDTKLDRGRFVQHHIFLLCFQIHLIVNKKDFHAKSSAENS